MTQDNGGQKTQEIPESATKFFPNDSDGEDEFFFDDRERGAIW